MKYHLAGLIDRINSGERCKFLFFWGHQPARDGAITASCFSQWWAGHPFAEGGMVYTTAEHYMMAEKARLFGDRAVEQKIMNAKTAAEAKELGREVRHFDQAIWEKHRFGIVLQGNGLKFGQHPALKDFLLQTGNRILAEASPVDRIWGIGLTKDHPDAESPERWPGLNLLGFALMEVRDRLRAA